MEVSIKIDDLELRTSGDGLHVVHWYKTSTCYTVALWEITKDGPDLRFIGSRPFQEDINMDTFWYLVKTGQEILERGQVWDGE